MHQMTWNTTEHINATVTLSLFRNNKSDKNDRRHHDFSIGIMIFSISSSSSSSSHLNILNRSEFS